VVENSQSSGFTYVKPQLRKAHDPAVKFEEYHYYAHKTRVEEETYVAPKLQWRELLFKKGDKHDQDDRPEAHMPSERELTNRRNRIEITDEEWTNASRAYRTASVGACE
jgi:hypothetical protein